MRGEGSNSHPGQQAFLALECFLSHVFENIYIASGMFLRSFTLQVEDLHRHWRVVGMAAKADNLDSSLCDEKMSSA